jgi:putative phosphoribosyl transferase
MFRDRKEAGQRLALALEKYRNGDTLVLAIPKGGIEIGLQVARRLEADFSVVVCRKLPFPDNPEAGFGAVAEDGSVFLQPDADRLLRPSEVERIRREQVQEIARRLKLFRNDQPLPPIEGRTVILVDDGLAMGSTMKAAVSLAGNAKAGKIVVAVPVASQRAAAEVGVAADEMVVLETPAFFQAVAQVYVRWHDVTDEEAVSLLESRRRAPRPGPKRGGIDKTEKEA